MNQELVEERILIKYSAPTKFCYSPYGQLWRQMHDNNESTLYIQLSRNEEEPEWCKYQTF